MSTLQFPANPVVGDTYDWDAYKYVWDGEKWKTKGIGYNPVNDLRDELEPRISNNESKVFEALRRSYAEAGYNLVDGSFEAGGTLTSTTDVLLHEASGKAYSGAGPFPQTVTAGTNPLVGGFTVVEIIQSTVPSYAGLRAYTGPAKSIYVTDFAGLAQPEGIAGEFVHDTNNYSSVDDGGVIIVDALGRRWKRVFTGNLQAVWYGVDILAADNIIPLQKASDRAHTLQLPLDLPAGEILISNTLTLIGGDAYHTPGMTLLGKGKDKTIIRLTSNAAVPVIDVPLRSGGGEVYGIVVRGMSLRGPSKATTTAGIRTHLLGMFEFSDLHTANTAAGIWAMDNAWVGRWFDMNFTFCDYGIRMDNSGTTNYFDKIFVYKATVTAYKLRTNYFTIGTLAADDCTGIAIYDLQYCSGTAGSLGYEQPSVQAPPLIISVDNATVSIDAVVGEGGVPTDGSKWNLIYVGNGEVGKIGSVTLTSPTPVTVNGTLVKGYRGSVRFGHISHANITFTGTDDESNTVVCVDDNRAQASSNGGGKPGIGMLEPDFSRVSPINSKWKNRRAQGVFFDSAGHPFHSGDPAAPISDRDRYTPAPGLGSLFLENDPLGTGRAGYVITVRGAPYTMEYAAFKGVQMITDVKPTTAPSASFRGQSFFSTTLGKPVWWNGSAWVDAMGTVVTP